MIFIKLGTLEHCALNMIGGSSTQKRACCLKKAQYRETFRPRPQVESKASRRFFLYYRCSIYPRPQFIQYYTSSTYTVMEIGSGTFSKTCQLPFGKNFEKLLDFDLPNRVPKIPKIAKIAKLVFTLKCNFYRASNHQNQSLFHNIGLSLYICLPIKLLVLS